MKRTVATRQARDDRGKRGSSHRALLTLGLIATFSLLGCQTDQAPESDEPPDQESLEDQIDRICDYYARSEPSSPVPILLKRARYLVHKSFPEILADLIPDAAGQFRVFEGNESGDGS